MELRTGPGRPLSREHWKERQHTVMSIGTTVTGHGAARGRLPILRGRLLDSADRPLPGAVLTLLDESGGAVAGGVTDGAGVIDLLAPGPGRFALVARRGPDAVAADVLIDARGTVPAIELRLGGRPAVTTSPAAAASAGPAPATVGPSARRRAGRFLLLAVPAAAGSAAAWYALVRWGGAPAMRRGLLTGGAPLMTMHGGGLPADTDPAGMHMGGAGAHLGMTASGAHPMHSSMTMFGMSMDHAPLSLSYAGLFAVMWSIMIVAMMLPAMLPAAREFLIAEAATAPAGGRFLGSVLGMWLAVGAAVYAALAAFQHYQPTPTPTALRIGAGVLLAVALFQFSRTKELMLTHVSGPFCCGAPGAGRAGLRHAWRCVASCGPYMIAVALIGTMSVFWMAVFAAIMFAEQILEVATGRGTLISRATGAAVGLVAMAVLFVPSTLPLVA
jgi:predicted metal-binding membrane protein